MKKPGLMPDPTCMTFILWLCVHPDVFNTLHHGLFTHTKVVIM